MKKLLYMITVLCGFVSLDAAILEVTSDADDGGAGTLRTVLGGASSGDTIVFADGVTYINLTNGYLDIDGDDIDIDGGGDVTLDAGGNSRIIRYRGTSGLEWSLTGLTFKNGYNSDSVEGGAIRLDTWGSSCDLLISDCIFINNSAEVGGRTGGAIYCQSGASDVIPHLIIENSTFTSNGPTAIATTSRVLDIKDTLFEGNWGSRGAAINLSAVTNEVSVWDNVTFLKNETSSSAGALRWSGGFIDLNNCIFDSNVTQSGGGACYLNGSTGKLNFEDCSFYNNIGSTNGYTSGGAVTVQNNGHSFIGCTFTNNSANSRGGGLYIFAVTTTNTIYNCTFVGNTALGDVGGAVGIEKCTLTGSVVIANSTFTENICNAGAIGLKDNDSNAGRPARLISCLAYGNFNTSLGSGNDVVVGWNGGGYDEVSNCLIGSRPASVESTALTYVDNLVGSDKDPEMGPLQDNGGNTLTIAIPKNSLAADAGSNPFGLEYDQRGAWYLREYGDGVDIGAFEYQPAGTIMIVR